MRLLRETDLYLFDTGNARRAYLTFGCHPLPQGAAARASWRFAVWAPHAAAVSVVGDFNGWDPAANVLDQVHPGVWAGVAEGIDDGTIYKYAITAADGTTRLKADPFAFHAENGLATGSKAWDVFGVRGGGYEWRDGLWMERRRASDPVREPMSIYELHLGSWRIPAGSTLPNYRIIADDLADYCTRMGYTHVELMPVTEHPLPASWGYQTTGYYSLNSRFGTPQDFMYFVDTMHRAGVGVICDWAPAHFPKDDWALARFDGKPLFEYDDPRKAEHAEWGTLVFDYNKPQVVSFLVSSAMFLLDAYHIDGLRVDAVTSMLYLDYARDEWVPNEQGGNINLEAVAFVRKLNEAVLGTYPGAVTVAEESTAYPMVTRPPYDGGLGFTFKWDMGYMHDALDYFSLDPLFRSGSHDKLTFGMMYAFSENYVLAFSHDEVVHGKKSMVQKMHGEYLEKFSNLRALMGFTFARPGKKLTFMGSEFAQMIEWDYQKELDWFLLKYPIHSGMQAFSAALNEFYRAHPALWRIDDGWEGFAWCNVDDRDESAIAFLRTSGIPGDADVVCCCNFTPNKLEGFTVGLPSGGTLVEALSSDELRFGGSDVRNCDPIPVVKGEFSSHPCHANVTLAPLSCAYFVFRRSSKGA